ncbi:TIGR01777 family oxidoreductase [soil metagenome]
MKSKKIIIAGGSGFIGQALCNYFGNENEIIILGRQLPHQKSNSFGESTVNKTIEKKIRFVKWDGVNKGSWMNEMEGADLVINLAGKTVNCRYNEKNKQEIFDSRTNTTKILATAIRDAKVPPKLWINAGSATIYPNATDNPRDESFTELNNDFSVQVCKLWEKTFYEEQTPGTRKVLLRMAITLGAGGVMIPYFNLLKFGLGGRQGNGKQMYSWIHIDDTCSMINWITTHEELDGTFNCCSPNPVSNDEFMKTLRKAASCSFGLPAYKWMLKIGAALIGTETELILKSRWVIPTRILTTGFQFSYARLPDAMKEIISNTPEKQYRLFA